MFRADNFDENFNDECDEEEDLCKSAEFEGGEHTVLNVKHWRIPQKSTWIVLNARETSSLDCLDTFFTYADGICKQMVINIMKTPEGYRSCAVHFFKVLNFSEFSDAAIWKDFQRQNIFLR